MKLGSVEIHADKYILKLSQNITRFALSTSVYGVIAPFHGYLSKNVFLSTELLWESVEIGRNIPHIRTNKRPDIV